MMPTTLENGAQKDRYDLFIKHCTETAEAFNLTLDQYFDCTLRESVIGYEKSVDFNEAWAWPEKEIFLNKYYEEKTEDKTLTKIELAIKENDKNRQNVRAHLQQGTGRFSQSDLANQITVQAALELALYLAKGFDKRAAIRQFSAKVNIH